MSKMVRIELFRDVEYGSFYSPKGEYWTTTKEDAKACVESGAARYVE